MDTLQISALSSSTSVQNDSNLHLHQHLQIFTAINCNIWSTLTVVRTWKLIEFSQLWTHLPSTNTGMCLYVRERHEGELQHDNETNSLQRFNRINENTTASHQQFFFLIELKKRVFSNHFWLSSALLQEFTQGVSILKRNVYWMFYSCYKTT